VEKWIWNDYWRRVALRWRLASSGGFISRFNFKLRSKIIHYKTLYLAITNLKKKHKKICDKSEKINYQEVEADWKRSYSYLISSSAHPHPLLIGSSSKVKSNYNGYAKSLPGESTKVFARFPQNLIAVWFSNQFSSFNLVSTKTRIFDAARCSR
jgi:hypothetical protein